MNDEQTWWVPIRGEPSGPAQAAIANAGGRLTGLSHSTSSGGAPQHSFSALIEAPTARVAVERLRRTLEGVGVYVRDEEDVQPLTDD